MAKHRSGPGNTAGMPLKKLLSVIVLDFKNAMDESQFIGLKDRINVPVFVSREEELEFFSDKNIKRIAAGPHKEGQHFLKGYDSIETPWILLLEKDEFLNRESLRELETALQGIEAKPWQVAVERFHSAELLKTYEWFTTRDVFDPPDKAIAKYFAMEIRLIPASHLGKLMIKFNGDDDPSNYHIAVDQYDKGADTGPFRITIRRKYRPEKTEQSKPLDRDIYKDGHQKYFDDRNYIDTFRWPLSSYGTARREHIPGIIEALKEGLSSPRIVNYVLIYLYHYGLFGQARELLFHIPSEWEKRYSIILQLKGMVEFISGNHSKALKICEKAERYFPEDTRNLENLGKILLLLGNTAKANKIFEKVKNIFNRKGLPDARPYLNTFLEIMDSNSGRTPTLSLCMIVRDEEETMPQALQYIAEGVDEIVVVDTGSKDKTKEMAASFGARVYDYQWQDDFSAARNFAIEQATGDYVFMVDADESLSTFHLLNFRVLKSLLPLEEPQAFRVPIGKLNIKTDWIHIASGVDNFVCESKPIRIFPRLPGIIYSRRVCEDIQEAIDEKEIHILDLPPSEIYLLHDERDREKRKTRKIGAYRQEDAESQTVILNAIQDFSRLGMEKETIYWLETLLNQYDEEPWAWRYEIWLAKLLESSKPERSYEILKDLRTKYPENESILNELASYLIRFNRLSDLASTDFPALHESNASNALSALEYQVYSALSDFLGGNINTAAESLDHVLSENSGYLLGQTARFFILATVGEIEGSIRALGDILEIVDRPRDTFENSLLECLQLGEEACDVLQRKEKFVARGLILQGVVNMEKLMEVV